MARGLEGPLAAFRDVILTDSTVIRLHDLLEKRFPACGLDPVRWTVGLRCQPLRKHRLEWLDARIPPGPSTCKHVPAYR